MYNTFRATPSWAKIETFVLPGSSRSNDVLRQYSGMFIDMKGSHSLSKSKNREKTAWPGVITSCLTLGIGNTSQVITLMFRHFHNNLETQFEKDNKRSAANVEILVQWNSPLSVKFLMKCPNKFVLKLVKQTIKTPAIYYNTVLGFYLI